MFKVINTNHFPLKGTNDRFWHMATITKGVREFMVFIDTVGQATYIEEITGGGLNKILEDDIWADLRKMVDEQNLAAWIKR